MLLYLFVFRSLFTFGALRFGCHKEMFEISCANAEVGSGKLCVTMCSLCRMNGFDASSEWQVRFVFVDDFIVV